ncbi:MAG: hypothetical protein R2729_28540 [Bryobacteraceae bacterium]
MLVFDGSRISSSRGSVGPGELALIESLAVDTPEGFFLSVLHGAGLTLLGSRFRTDDGRTPNYRGPYFDVYRWVHVGGPIALLRRKHVLVESITQSLAKVQYADQSSNPPTQIETIFEQWGPEEGAPPGRIVRTENGREVLRLDIAHLERGPRADPPAFRLP